MQKKFIALAVAGLVSGAAFAQSNVTVYGVADATFEFATISDSVTSGSNVGTQTRVNSNSSLIGFKGEEALGNGLKAIFQIETGLALDSNAATLGGARDTFVGLNGGFGTVKLGNVTGPTRALGNAVDMNAGATGPGANSSIIGKPQGFNATGAQSGFGTFDTRLANSIAYVSPSFGGVNVSAVYSSGENRTTDATATASQMDSRTYDLGATYSNGPIFAGLTYGKVDNKREGAFTGADEASIWRLAGAYTLPAGHKVAALYEQNRLETGVAGVRTEVKQNTWGLGGKFMVTPAGGLIAQYYRANDASGTAANNNTGAALYELGYEHSLSKRTMLKASYTQLNNKSGAAFAFGNGATGGVTAGADLRVIAAGIRHAF